VLSEVELAAAAGIVRLIGCPIWRSSERVDRCPPVYSRCRSCFLGSYPEGGVLLLFFLGAEAPREEIRSAVSACLPGFVLSWRCFPICLERDWILTPGLGGCRFGAACSSVFQDVELSSARLVFLPAGPKLRLWGCVTAETTPETTSETTSK
jgi:hypothetical protein